MNIKKLELQGFKSFSDRKKIILHPGITAIVGPNGTGKSNIVDALLWVLGAKRFKSLRGERSQDIIFNGNTKVVPMSMADVNLFLEDDNEELIINHRLYRSGESEYRMNGKISRLKDIQEALWKKAIGETEYFVIEQGNIGLFLTSKPTEKRLLLEEAAGTAYYKDKKRQTQNKLENSEQNLIRLEDIIAEVSKAKNSLKRQAHAAIRYRKLREKTRELTVYLYKKKAERLENNQREASSAYRKGLDYENETVAMLKSEEKSLAIRRKEIWNLENLIKKEYENLLSLKTQISQTETEKERESRRIDLHHEKRETAKKSTKELEVELIAFEKERTDAIENLKKLKKTLKQKLEAQNSTDEAIQISQEELGNKLKRIEKIRNDSFQKLSSHTEMRNEKAKMDKEIELIRRQEEKLRIQLKSEKLLLKEIENKIEQHNKSITDTRLLFEKKRSDVEGYQSKTREIQPHIENLQSQLSEKEKAQEKDKHHLYALEELEKKERSTELSASLPGAMGLIADLIESQPDKAILIDAFWKDEAKSMLIKGQDFLKNLEGNYSKGDFFLLSSKKKEEPHSEVYKNPKALGLLKAYVQKDPKIKELLPQLSEAVVVQDVKSAVELWIQFPSSNFITLKGDILLQSGLLKLGKRKEGLFALKQDIKILKEKIANRDKEIDPVKLQIQEEIEKRQQLEGQISEKTKDATQLGQGIEAEEKEKEYSQLEKKKIETRIFIIEKELSVLLKDKQELAQKLEELIKKIKYLESNQDALKNDLAKEEKNISLLRESEEQKRKTFFEIKSSVDIHKEKIKNLEQQISALQKREEINESKISALKREIQESKELESKLHENIHNLLKKSVQREKEKKEKETQLTQKESQLKKEQADQLELEKIVEKLREENEARKEKRVQEEIKKAEVERDLVNLEESCWQELKKTLQEIKDEKPPEGIQEENIEETLAQAKENLEKFKLVNLMAEEEYLSQKERYDFLIKQRGDLRESIDSTKEAIKKIDQESKAQFSKAINEVNKAFKEIFSLLFEGGHAELKLTDPNQPLESGVDIVAQPPGKRLQSLNLLSGGERSLTSLAFFFALFRYKPTPFCILDEVDAALDETNLARFLNLMKKIKAQTQFIIITHNFKTMEVADFIYGTTMAEPNITNIYSVKLERKEAPKK